MHAQLQGYLSVIQAAKASGYNPQYLRRLARKGKLPYTKVGYMIFFEANVIEEYARAAEESGSGRRGPRSEIFKQEENTM